MMASIHICLLSAFLLVIQTSCYPSKGSTPDVVFPERVGSLRHRRDLSTATHDGHEDRASFRFNGLGRDFELELIRNKDFHTSSVLLKKFDSDDNEIIERHKPTSCFYHGKVKNDDDSYVLMSTYKGALRGHIETQGKTFNLEPNEDAEDGSHILYVPIDDEDEFMMNNKTCAMDEDQSSEEEAFTPERQSRVRRSLSSLSSLVDVEPQYIPYLTTMNTRYCETYVIVDNEIYQRYNNDTGLVIERILNNFHSVDRAYSAINIRIVVVAMEIWTNGDRFTRTMHDSVADYNSVKKYFRENIKGKMTYDVVQFMSHKSWSDGVAGRGAVPGVCSVNGPIGINAHSFSSVTGSTIVVGHEMGHNFNFPHDADMVNCTCLAGKRGCFMGGTKTRRPGFTTCNMGRLAARPFHCLNNYPLGPFGKTCGNGIIEAGEQCDCGTVEMCNKMDPCCEPGKCVLKLSAQCSDLSTPDCCGNCRMKLQGTLCRASNSICDVNEYCTGSSPTCPPDHTTADGTRCSDTKILLKGSQKWRGISINILDSHITARYLKIIPHDNAISTVPCLTLEVLASDSAQALAAVPTPISTRDLYYTSSLCVVPDITDCSDQTDAILKYKRMAHGNCNHPEMQFVLENDGTLRHKCTNKVVCPNNSRHLHIQSSCETPGDEKYDRTAKRSIKHRTSGRCFLSEAGWPKDGRFIYLSSGCDNGHYRSLHDFLIPDSLLPVGMEAGFFPDNGFSSNVETNSNNASQARLRTGDGFCFNKLVKSNPYLKIDLGSVKDIGGLEAGSSTSQYVSAFYVEYSQDGVHWVSYTESGANGELSNSYCYAGRCTPTLSNQCKDLWDAGATKADDQCWDKFNIEANGFGTCDAATPTPCTPQDVKCGQLQCLSSRTTPLHLNYAASYSKISLEGTISCSAANITDKSDDEGDSGLGMVSPGTKCGDSNVCKNNQCIDISLANYPTCSSVGGKVCAGRGICLNNGECHCDNGYDPSTYCKEELVARDGEVGQWSSWSSCSKGCGGGERARARFCDSPFPVHGGKNCRDTMVEEDQCNTDACTVGSSCRHILQSADGKQLHDGIYTVQLPDGTTLPVYCDMTRNGGGWTLVVASNSATWTAESVYERNKDEPSLYKDYSIINYVDAMKDTYMIPATHMEYRLEAQERGKWGGIWTAPSSYLFKSTSKEQTDVTLKEKFSIWDSVKENIDLATRMPYIFNDKITTSRDVTRKREGSITDNLGGYSVAKWMDGSLEEKKPESIMYWMREGPHQAPKSCREIQLRGLTSNKLYPDGVYSIQSKSGQLVNTYCDLTRYGGGWTLVVTSPAEGGFTEANVKMFNTDSPSLTTAYSILGMADEIIDMDPTEDSYHYMIEANGNDRYGGILSAPLTAKLTTLCETVKPNLLKQFDTWDASTTLGIQVPQVAATKGMLFTTSSKDPLDRTGALIKMQGETASYLPGTLDSPSVVRFWIREGVTRRSCNDIKVHGVQRGHAYDDGYYTVKYGDCSIMPVYCDMTSDLGAWTLIVTSKHGSWTSDQVRSRNTNQPSLDGDYSILSMADGMKRLSNNATFQYKLAAQELNRWGGVFEAPMEYSFVSDSNSNDGVTLLKQFNTWDYNVWYKTVGNRMPWLGNPSHGKGLLTTSGTDDYYWYGTIVSGNDEYKPAPWINSHGMSSPGVIYYFVNEDDCDQSRVAVHGGLSQWNTWSTCSSLCSSGIQTRKRSCSTPRPRCGGNPCDKEAVVEEHKACVGVCPVSAIKSDDDLYCIMPETGTCSFDAPTKLVWSSGIDKCSLNHSKFIFNVETGSIMHACSGVSVCPRGGSTSTGVDLVVDPACPQPTISKHFLRTHGDSLSYGGMCCHPNGGWRRNGVNVVLWSGCFNNRLKMEFYEMPHGLVKASYFMAVNSTVKDIESALHDDVRFPNNPSTSGFLDNLELPSNVGSNYGVQLLCYFVAPQTGQFTFHTSCDNLCDLYLGSSTEIASKERIVRQTSASGRHNYKDTPSQSSAPVNLIVGQKYYIEAAFVEFGGSDHMSIAVTLPDGTMIAPITKHYLAALV